MPEKPINRPMEIPAGRPVEQEGDMMSRAMGPEPSDELPEITPDEEGQVDVLLGTMLDFVWGDGYDTIVKKLRSGQDNLERRHAKNVGSLLGVGPAPSPVFHLSMTGEGAGPTRSSRIILKQAPDWPGKGQSAVCG